ncbi:MAG: sulfatase-like hydrolase/transferase [Clostridia bacterium]|nr:sulfatase-like hydrolase/transferase [Clostridia bacterium]
MKKGIEFDKSKKVFPIIIAVIGLVMMLAMWITRLNMTAVVSVAYCCIVSALILLSLLFKKRLYLWMVVGYVASLFGIVTYFIVFGADAGFGAFTSGLEGFSTTDHPWLTGEGNFFTRLLGNLLLALSSVAALVLTVVTVIYAKEKAVFQKVFSRILSFVLVLTTVAFVLTMNLRSKPNVERMWEGHDDYLGKIDNNKTKSSSPNIVFIMMDDLGYGDISANGAIYDTPNIDRIADEGVQFVNFYSSYSVCSPSRFAALTGRYPYRGYADNVIYPTVDTITPFASTRIFNSIEMGANADGMLGDEITIAEVLKSAGYATGCFGKWHLGDYGEYLPTNQGFDYFYGSHHVNDMTPFYHVREENGEYEIVRGTDELKDQSNATKWIYEELNSWITDTAKNSDQPFFAYYATPWPHAPVFVGDEFKGASGMGTYVDCVTEFDYYLGQLFNSLEELGVMDDTIIIFTSDNGPALEGSVNDLRGGKYLAYEGGQKVPFLIRWGNNGGLFSAGSTVEESATLVDLFPTLIEMCGISGNGGEESFMPSDREIDGVSMIPAIKDHEVIHTYENPILHMKREDIKAIQYAIPTANILATDEYKDYDYDVLKNNEYLVFKYFKRIQNDNSAFFDKYRKNWLHILTDDVGENYNRTPTYPTIADEMRERLEEIAKDFKENRRGIVRS